MNNEALLNRRLKTIAKRCQGSTPKTVDAATSWHATNIVEAARGAQKRCPEDDKGKCWLESYMAMNAGSDKMARKVIEAKCWDMFKGGF